MLTLDEEVRVVNVSQDNETSFLVAESEVRSIVGNLTETEGSVFSSVESLTFINFVEVEVKEIWIGVSKNVFVFKCAWNGIETGLDNEIETWVSRGFNTLPQVRV